MKKILINAITIKEGGGVVVLTKLLEEMCALRSDIQWIVIVDPVMRLKINTTNNIKLLCFSWTKRSPFHMVYWYEIYLPLLIKQHQIDAVFSQTNFLPLRKLSCPTLLLMHQAGYFSDIFMALQWQYKSRWYQKLNWKLRCALAHHSIKCATLVTVQTQALAD